MKISTILLVLIAAIAVAIVLGKEAVSEAISTISAKSQDISQGIVEVATQKVADLAPGTYVIAGTVENPLAFSVVGGDDYTPSTQTLFGDQSGYGGITAGGGSAGASGSRPGGTGTWTSAGYVTSY